MAIDTELLKAAISSSSLYFSTLVINIAFSCLCPGVVISIFSVLQLTAIFNTWSHPSSFVTFTFSCFSAFNHLHQMTQVSFFLHTALPSPIPSSSSTLLSSPQPSATPTPTPPPLPPKLCLPIYQNTDEANLYPRITSLSKLNYSLSSFHFQERLCTNCG